MTIHELQIRAKEEAAHNGWEEVNIPTMIALIHSEASEALESYRNGEPISWSREDSNGRQKPEGIASEFADIMIRVAHYACILGIDLTTAIDEKMNYNKTRGFRHGGKVV